MHPNPNPKIRDRQVNAVEIETILKYLSCLHYRFRQLRPTSFWAVSGMPATIFLYYIFLFLFFQFGITLALSHTRRFGLRAWALRRVGDSALFDDAVFFVFFLYI